LNPNKEAFTEFIYALLNEAHKKIAEVGLLSHDKRFNDFLKASDDDNKETTSNNIEIKIHEDNF